VGLLWGKGFDQVPRADPGITGSVSQIRPPMPSVTALGVILMALMVLVLHHGECSRSSRSAESSCHQVCCFVFLAVLELQQLVSRKCGGCNSNDKVNVFAEMDIFGSAFKQAAGRSRGGMARWCKRPR